ncbi:hypothetical protein AAC387_Pa03g3131 [Persea americana]
MPFTRMQNVLDIDHIVKFTEGTTFITLQFKNRRQHVWHPIEGDVSTIMSETDPLAEKNALLYANSLWSHKSRHSLIRGMLSCFDLSCALDEVESEVSRCLLNLLSTAKDEGFNAIDVVFTIDVVTVDSYDEEMISQVISQFGVTAPASRSSIQALPSRVFDGMSSSYKCTICLDEFSLGMTVTQLPCLHDFHLRCIETWLNKTNKCPLCRSSI